MKIRIIFDCYSGASSGRTIIVSSDCVIWNAEFGAGLQVRFLE